MHNLDDLEAGKLAKFTQIMVVDSIDLYKLRELVWSGCPGGYPSCRVISWKVLTGFYPPRVDRHHDVQLKKAKEYQSLLHEHECNIDIVSMRGDHQRNILHQIDIDVPRTVTLDTDLMKKAPFFNLIRRVLMIWSLRNPACGYVQGMNDVASPLLIVLLRGASETLLDRSKEVDIESLDLLTIESDLYWMFSRLIQRVQDHYTSSQPGIQKMMKHFRDIISRIDRELSSHLEDLQIDLQQISFRWFNCLLTRELNYESLIRVWDTCIAEEDGFSVFLVYFCAVLLTRQSHRIRAMGFQDIMTLLSNSKDSFGLLSVRDIEAVISEAFVLKSLFHSSPSHLNSS